MAHDKQTGEIDDQEVLQGEIVEPIGTGVLATIHRVEIDQQVATAKQYPRNVPMIKQELTALVTIDEDTGEECIYALPRGGKTIKGPSARFADALISFWGNARSGAFITQVDKEAGFVEAIGSFQDVERNVIRQRRVRRSILNSRGQLYNADMINMTGNAACVIAERNAILNGIPKSLWASAYERAFTLVAGNIQTLSSKIERAMGVFNAMGITPEQVLEKIGRADVSKIVPDDIVSMRGMITALKTGEETLESIFGRGAAGHQHETVKNPLKDNAAGEAGKDTLPKQQREKSDLVIDSDGKVVKSGKPGVKIETVFDERFRAGEQYFDNLPEWEASIKEAKLDDPRESGAKSQETQANDAKGGEKDASADRVADKETTGTASEASGKAAGEGSATDSQAGVEGQNNARTAQTQAAGAAKSPAASGLPSFEDDKAYIAFMHDQFDTATSQAAVKDIWAKTRDDRRELLGAEQIEELTKDKDAKLRKLSGKGGL